MTAPRVCSIAAHPRSRGENSWFISCVVTFWGSSPLTRGKLCRGNGPRSSRRLIPAHAGKTILTVAGAIFAQAHPRSRGENELPVVSSHAPGGLIPAHAGKTVVGGIAAAFGGLIPAHAGKTSRERAAICSFQAHPRSRGENGPPRQPPPDMWGSSPLTRGKHGGLHVLHGRPGLIPAHAGKTSCSSQSRPSTQAHPRSRGENSHSR